MSKLPLFRNTEIFTDPVKLLIKESHAIFTTIPRNDSDLNKANVIAISRNYRSILHECVENLTRDISRDNSDQIKTFKELEVIWSLCEILLLDVAQAGTLIIQLRNWINAHLAEMDPDAKDLLRSLNDKNTSRINEDSITDTYWDLLVKLVVQGDTKRAIQLISCHPDFRRSNQMQKVAEMLEKMPLSNQYIVHEFINRWNNWSLDCKRELETRQFENNPHLYNIVRLLSQDKSVYADLAPKCETWYQLMVTYLTYSDPCIRESDTSELARQMISTFKKNNPGKQNAGDFFNEIIISTFEYDLLAVIANSCAYLDDNWWFVTHFIDLLHCCNQLHMHEIADCEKLHESFLQDYAATLFDDQLLWPIGVSYLDKCKNSGMHFLEIELSRIPLSIDDEVKANKVISIAKKRGLNNLPKSVCLLMARGWLCRTTRLGNEATTNKTQQDKAHKRHSADTKGLPNAINLSNALYWAVKSGDSAIITHISDQFLHYYCKTGTFPDSSVFENLQRSQLDNERLAFLTKYHEFRQLVEEDGDDMTDAGNLLRALLASKIFPKFFCHELLEDAKHTLDIRPVLVFRPNHTIDLMRSIEEITKGETIEEDIELRRNLVKNMARALITPVGSEN